MSISAFPPVFGKARDEQNGRSFVVYITGMIAGDEYTMQPRYLAHAFDVHTDEIRPIVIRSFEPHTPADGDRPWPLMLAYEQITLA